MNIEMNYKLCVNDIVAQLNENDLAEFICKLERAARSNDVLEALTQHFLLEYLKENSSEEFSESLWSLLSGSKYKDQLDDLIKDAERYRKLQKILSGCKTYDMPAELSELYEEKYITHDNLNEALDKIIDEDNAPI